MENIFHRYIELPFTIEKPVEFNQYWDTVFHFDLGLEKQYSKNMLNWLNLFDLITTNVDCFYTPPGGKITPHADSNIFNNQVKINITWGPDEARTLWWKSERYYRSVYAGEESNVMKRSFDLLEAEEKDCELLYSANTNRPSLVNVGQLHSTYNPGFIGRHTLCFNLSYRDETPVDWYSAIKILKDFIK
jgi:hypothetical protein